MSTHVLEIPQHIFFRSWANPGFTIPLVAQRVQPNIHFLGAHYRIRNGIGSLPNIHCGDSGAVVPNGFYHILHIQNRSVAVHAAVLRQSLVVLLWDYELLDFRPDAITANDHIRNGRGAVFKAQTHSRRGLFEFLEPLPKMRNFAWYELDQGVEEICPSHGGLSRRRGLQVHESLTGLFSGSPNDFKPCLPQMLIARAVRVRCDQLIIDVAYLRINERHRPVGCRPDRQAQSNFFEGRSGFIYLD